MFFKCALLKEFNTNIKCSLPAKLKKNAIRFFFFYYSLNKFACDWKEVNMFYVGETDPEKLVNTSIKAMLAALDPDTAYSGFLGLWLESRRNLLPRGRGGCPLVA